MQPPELSKHLQSRVYACPACSPTALHVGQQQTLAQAGWVGGPCYSFSGSPILGGVPKILARQVQKLSKGPKQSKLQILMYVVLMSFKKILQKLTWGEKVKLHTG